jgi:cation/acetate symporter
MQSNVNGISIGFFFVFMALTLSITYWAAKRTSTTEHFFAAGGAITAWQNGWALAGDFLSAAALLGIAGIITANGFDGMIYSIGWLVGWPIMLFLIVSHYETSVNSLSPTSWPIGWDRGRSDRLRRSVRLRSYYSI